MYVVLIKEVPSDDMAHITNVTVSLATDETEEEEVLMFEDEYDAKVYITDVYTTYWANSDSNTAGCYMKIAHEGTLTINRMSGGQIVYQVTEV